MINKKIYCNNNLLGFVKLSATIIFMAGTTLRQMPHTEIDDSFKLEFLGALGGSHNLFWLAPLGDKVCLPHLKKRV